jgi:hypothetical protein
MSHRTPIHQDAVLFQHAWNRLIDADEEVGQTVGRIDCRERLDKLELPDEIDDKGSAQQLRRLFAPLALVEKIMCSKCAEKVNKGRQTIGVKRRQLKGR